jgi:hypothetical protein
MALGPVELLSTDLTQKIESPTVSLNIAVEATTSHIGILAFIWR